MSISPRWSFLSVSATRACSSSTTGRSPAKHVRPSDTAENTAEPAQQTLKQYIFYLLRYCVFCTPHVRNVGIPPLYETYPPFCEHPFGASSYPARSYEQSQSMTLVIWMPSSVMPSLCQSRVSTVRGNASPNRRSGANSRSRVCSSVMFNVT